MQGVRGGQMKMRPSRGRAQTAAMRALQSGKISHDSLSCVFIRTLGSVGMNEYREQITDPSGGNLTLVLRWQYQMIWMIIKLWPSTAEIIVWLDYYFFLIILHHASSKSAAEFLNLIGLDTLPTIAPLSALQSSCVIPKLCNSQWDCGYIKTFSLSEEWTILHFPGSY